MNSELTMIKLLVLAEKANRVRDRLVIACAFQIGSNERQEYAVEAENEFRLMAEAFGYRVEPIAAAAATVRTDVPMFKPLPGLSDAGVPV